MTLETNDVVRVAIKVYDYTWKYSLNFVGGYKLPLWPM
jgi:hypothetical protein